MEKVELFNVQCISHATINIELNKINIRYGYNGLGKSSIGKGIQYYFDGEEKLKTLKPFGSKNKPVVVFQGDTTIKSCETFNNEYIKQWLFDSKSLISDSYSAFFNSDDLNNKRDDINKLINNVLNATKDNVIESYIKKFEDISKHIKFNKDKSYKKGSTLQLGFSKGIDFVKKLNPVVKETYEDYLYDEYSDKWAKWFVEGLDYIDGYDNKCPFCNRELPNEFFDNSKALRELFSSTDFANNAAAREAVRQLFCFTSNGHESKAAPRFDNEHEFEDEYKISIYDSYKSFEYEISKINELRKLNYIKDEDNNLTKDLLAKFDQYKLNVESFFYIREGEYTGEEYAEAARRVNEEIDYLKDSIEEFIDAQKKYNDDINLAIKESKEEINEFLFLAGIPYRFELTFDGETATSSIIPNKENKEIKNPDERLSYGESNSFALALFGAIAKRGSSDLIILDDPISSFDENKKFAVMHFLFNRNNGVLKDRTVLMLTHDMEPIIDLFKSNTIKFKDDEVPDTCLLIKDDFGEIIEKPLDKKDIQSVAEYEFAMAIDKTKDLYIRCIHLRKYLEIVGNRAHPINHHIYNILSAVEHLNRQPYDTINKKQIKYNLHSDEYMEFIKEIKSKYKFDTFDLNNIVDYYSNIVNAIQGYENTDDPYEKLIFLRLILGIAKNDGKYIDIPPSEWNFITETYHISNSYLYALQSNKQIPPYMSSMCEEIIEKVFLVYEIK